MFRQKNQATQLIRFGVVYLMFLLLFMLFRLAILFYFGNYADIRGHHTDIVRSFAVGFRFDTMIIFYGLLPLFLFTVVATFFVVGQRIQQRIVLWYSMFAFLVFGLLLLLDFYYYKFFHSHFNLLVFGLIDDDTKAVLRSMWTDYPVIRVSIALFVFVFLLRLVLRRMLSKAFDYKLFASRYANIALFAVLVGLYVLGMRGSVSMYPLCKNNRIVSSNTFINSLTLNGVFALQDAFVDRQTYQISADYAQTLSRFGFRDTQEVYHGFARMAIADSSSVDSTMFDTTAKNKLLDSIPPHVVVVMMESMSNYYLDFHSPELNLLGKLEGMLPRCVLFRNFVSATNGTIHSLEGLVVSSPITPLSMSEYFQLPLATATALPFKQKGYKTNFLTGAKIGWRNLEFFVPKQYFDNVEGDVSIEEAVAGSSKGEWGVYDEFVFDRALAILKEATSPQYIFIFTTTNHTPYELPDTYKPYPINLPDSVKGKLKCDEAIARKNFTAYQYGNNALGSFLEQLKANGLIQKTIVAASGDHNSLALFNFSDDHLLHKLSVPLLLHIPEAYMPSAVNTRRFGSHKDIFPTLYNLALSDRRYFRSGNNLFDSLPSKHFFSSYLNNIALNEDGAVIYDTKPLYFKWKAPGVLSEAESSPALDSLMLHLRLQSAASSLYIQRLLQQ